MLKFRWSLAAVLTLAALVTLGTSVAGAAPWRAQANLTVRVAASPGALLQLVRISRKR